MNGCVCIMAYLCPCVVAGQIWGLAKLGSPWVCGFGVGLLAAIPASIAYNAFATRLDGVESALGLYSEELIEDLGLTAPPSSNLELLEDL